MRRKLIKLLISASALFLVGGICWLLIGVTIKFPAKSPRQKLDEARALWQVKGSKDYQMDVVLGAAMSFLEGYRLIVHDNKVTDILGFAPLYSTIDPQPLAPSEKVLAQSNYFAQKISPDLKQYTVDGLFNIAATRVANDSSLISWCSMDVPSHPDISFNREYGYIESYELGNCPKWEIGGGLMCGVISDCTAGMRVRNLTFLPPGQ